MSDPHIDAEYLADRIRNICDAGVQGDGLDEVADNWVMLHTAHRELGVLVDDYALAAGTMLSDQEYDLKTGYELPDSTLVHHAQRRSKVQWRGRSLLRHISTEMVEPETGEVTTAIPLSVLCDIIPGVASDESTSSKWLLGGLRNIDVDPDDYRHSEWAPVRVVLGAKR